MTNGKIIPNYLTTKWKLFTNGHVVVSRHKVPTPCRLELSIATIIPYNMFLKTTPLPQKFPIQLESMLDKQSIMLLFI
jgi:hypothetical protein